MAFWGPHCIQLGILRGFLAVATVLRVDPLFLGFTLKLDGMPKSHFYLKGRFSLQIG